MSLFGDTPPQPNFQDDDHLLLFKLASAAYNLSLGGGGGGGITALTGDVTASGSGSVAATVANISGVTGITTAASILTKVTIAGATNSTPLTITGGSITSGTAPFLSITGTWNTATGPTAILANITNTASVSPLLMDLQVGSVSQFKAAVDGSLTIASTPQTAFLMVNPAQVGGADYAISFLAKFGNINGGTGNFFLLNSGAGPLLTANSAIFEIPQATINLAAVTKTTSVTPQTGYVTINVAGVATKFLTG